MNKKLFLLPQQWLDQSRVASFIAPLLLRAYLVPVFWLAGMSKYQHFDSTVQWFGNEEWGLGLPVPTTMALLVMMFELIGALCLAIGLLTRVMALPLMLAMLVAAVSVHLKNGWLAIASGNSEASLNLQTALNQLRDQNPELYTQVMQYGKPVILNNGIEFAATYFIMLLALFFMGGGRWVSLDYWIRRWMDNNLHK